MKKILFYFAVLGLTLGLIVHLVSISGIDITENIPFTWVLHLGLFVVWVPTIFTLGKNEELKAYKQSGTRNNLNPFKFFKIVFRQTPAWLTTIAIVCFFYAGLNFFLFIISQPGVTSIKNGQYILHNHGTLIRTLTEQEYHHYKANEVRGFSGHWLVFYSFAAAALYPFNKQVSNS